MRRFLTFCSTRFKAQMGHGAFANWHGRWVFFAGSGSLAFSQGWQIKFEKAVSPRVLFPFKSVYFSGLFLA